MKVGEYVRTDKGYIAKISDFIEHYTKGKRLGIKEEVIENFLLFDNKHCEIIESIDYSIPPCYPSDEELAKIKSHIVKSSPNIIDLIEVGDYVNGKKVVDKWEEPNWYGYFIKLEGEETIPTIRKIESIVTKEQFESMEYRIEE
jgi:hypothetical protein